MTPTTTATATPSGRLRNGQLRALVARFLADHASSDHTPREIAAKLPGGIRSAGAVLNAAQRLAADGHAEQTSTKPVRFRATATTRTATTPALAPTPTAPGK